MCLEPQPGGGQVLLRADLYSTLKIVCCERHVTSTLKKVHIFVILTKISGKTCLRLTTVQGRGAHARGFAMERKQHLRALGLPETALVDKKAVRAAYIAASKKYHPDRHYHYGTGNTEALRVRGKRRRRNQSCMHTVNVAPSVLHTHTPTTSHIHAPAVALAKRVVFPLRPQAKNSARFQRAKEAQDYLLSNSTARRWEEAKRAGTARTAEEVYRANHASSQGGPNITPPKLTFKQNIGLRLGVWFFICGLAVHDNWTTKREHRNLLQSAGGGGSADSGGDDDVAGRVDGPPR